MARCSDWLRRPAFDTLNVGLRCRKRQGVPRFFATILIEGELGYGKPEERVYRQALAQLDLEAGEVWSVGDHLDWDVAAPQRLGMFGIWNDFRREGLPPSSPVVPDRIIRGIRELVG